MLLNLMVQIIVKNYILHNLLLQLHQLNIIIERLQIHR
nr:MAG TPA: hypothetical protein [Caudoviricetes sp.]